MTCTVESWFSSLSQPFSAVIQSRAGEAQQDLKNEETQAQGLLSDTALTLPVPQLQEDATDARQSKDCLQALDKDDLAQQPGGLAIKPRGKRGSWGTAVICEYRFLDSSWHGLCQSGLEWSAQSSNRNPEQGTWSPPGHYTVLLVGPSMAEQVLPEAAQRPMQFQQVRMQGLGIVLWQRKAMLCLVPNPSNKVSPGLATGISTNTKVNQQPPLVCLPWRTDPVSVANDMWVQASWRGRAPGWEKGGQQKELYNKQEW